jgi:hypothetical protein
MPPTFRQDTARQERLASHLFAELPKGSRIVIRTSVLDGDTYEGVIAEPVKKHGHITLMPEGRLYPAIGKILSIEKLSPAQWKKDRQDEPDPDEHANLYRIEWAIDAGENKHATNYAWVEVSTN